MADVKKKLVAALVDSGLAEDTSSYLRAELQVQAFTSSLDEQGILEAQYEANRVLDQMRHGDAA